MAITPDTRTISPRQFILDVKAIVEPDSTATESFKYQGLKYDGDIKATELTR